MYIGIVLLCVDCVLASTRIAQADPGQHTEVPEGILSQLVIRASMGQHTEVPKNHNYALSVRIV
jgi:hypothetical protein